MFRRKLSWLIEKLGRLLEKLFAAIGERAIAEQEIRDYVRRWLLRQPQPHCPNERPP